MRLDVVCLSHLAFEEGLFQRPQHLMSQFVGRGHRVRYYGFVGQRRLSSLRAQGAATGTIAPPQPGGHSGSGEFAHFSFHPSVEKLRGLRQWLSSKMVRSALPSAAGRSHDSRLVPVTMIYHPGLIGLARQAGLLSVGQRPTSGAGPGRVLVYDIMDRFPAFAKSVHNTASCEAELLALADVRIAGGRSLQKSALAVGSGGSASDHSRPVFCLPSAVDQAHFRRALDPEGPVDAALAALKGPVAGYFGAIDERIDWELLRKLCAAMPGGHVVLTGPILGDRPTGLPQNLLLTGPRPHIDLPSVLRRFDVALIPFLQNELTAHISPTKAPEYLAGGCPVVSVAIPDVEAEWPGVIPIGRNHREFIDHVLATIGNPPDRWTVAGRAAKWPSWAGLAAEFERLIYQAAEVVG